MKRKIQPTYASRQAAQDALLARGDTIQESHNPFQIQTGKRMTNEKASVTFVVRITPEQRDLFKAAMQRAGVTVQSEALRHAMQMFCEAHEVDGFNPNEASWGGLRPYSVEDE